MLRNGKPAGKGSITVMRPCLCLGGEGHVGLQADAHKPGHASPVATLLPCWGAITDPCVTCDKKERKTHTRIPLRFTLPKRSGPLVVLSCPRSPPSPLRPDVIGRIPGSARQRRPLGTDPVQDGVTPVGSHMAWKASPLAPAACCPPSCWPRAGDCAPRVRAQHTAPAPQALPLELASQQRLPEPWF